MAEIPDSAREVLEGDGLCHLVTINADGSPQVSIVWVGLEDDEIVFASLMDRVKLKNIRRDPRVSLSIETRNVNPMGLREYLVVHGTGRVTEGGGPALLQRLAHTCLGPDVKFPPMDDPPEGWIGRIAPERFGGVGPWATYSLFTRSRQGTQALGGSWTSPQPGEIHMNPSRSAALRWGVSIAAVG